MGFELLGYEDLLFGSKFSEDEVFEVHLRGDFGADTEAVSGKAVAHVFQDAGDAIMTAGAAAGGDFAQSEIEGEVIIDDGDLRGLQFVETLQGAEGQTAFVHVRLRFDEPESLAWSAIPAGDFSVEAWLGAP